MTWRETEERSCVMGIHVKRFLAGNLYKILPSWKFIENANCFWNL